MKTKKECRNYFCNNKKLSYCSDCYQKVQTKLSKMTDKNDFKIMWIFILSFAFVGFLFQFPLLAYGDVDEDSYCLDKLNTYFPEYDFKEANFWSECHSDGRYKNTCEGSYFKQTNEIQRDGLKELSEESTEQIKLFKLTSQADIDFLGSDNTREGFFVIGFVFYLLACIVLFNYMIDKGCGR